MSILVSIEELPERLADFGAGYLLTTQVRPTWQGARLEVAAPGPGTLRNLAANATVSLVFPPADPQASGQHSLIIDGQAEAVGDDVLIVPTAAVLHRPA
jgi:hypothetical protein